MQGIVLIVIFLMRDIFLELGKCVNSLDLPQKSN